MCLMHDSILHEARYFQRMFQVTQQFVIPVLCHFGHVKLRH